MVSNLLISSSISIDIVFFVIIIAGIALGATRGFVRGVCKLGGWIFSTIVAFSFAAPFKNSLEKWFGLQTALSNALKSTTAASWISIVISFIALMVIVRFGAWLLGKIGSALIGTSRTLTGIDRFLGAILGLVEAALFIFIILTIFYWLNIASVNRFILSSNIVGKIYCWDWFLWAARLKFL